MIKRATALLALLALCGLLPAAAQEPQEEMKTKAVNMADGAKKTVAEGLVVRREHLVEARAVTIHHLLGLVDHTLVDHALGIVDRL